MTMTKLKKPAETHASASGQRLRLSRQTGHKFRDFFLDPLSQFENLAFWVRIPQNTVQTAKVAPGRTRQTPGWLSSVNVEGVFLPYFEGIT